MTTVKPKSPRNHSIGKATGGTESPRKHSGASTQSAAQQSSQLRQHIDPENPRKHSDASTQPSHPLPGRSSLRGSSAAEAEVSKKTSDVSSFHDQNLRVQLPRLNEANSKASY